MINIVKSIIRTGYPTDQEGYKKAHRRANSIERRVFGERKFQDLLRIISNVIPNGELAGSHALDGSISVSEKIPLIYRGQVSYHEYVEHLIMSSRDNGSIKNTRKQ